MGFKAAQRLEKFQTGIFAAMDAKKEALIASGREVINLSIGTPDFEPSRHVMEAVKEAVGDPFNYRYSLTDTPELLEALVSYYKRRYQTDIRPEEITGVHGTQEGMGHLGLAMVNPGDVVLLPDPGYPIYEAGSLLADAEIYYYGMVKENDFLPDMKEIPEDILKRARFIVLSYPSNPVGASAPKEMYLDMISLAKKYGFFIINDNAYSDIIFDGREGFSFLSLPEAKEVGVEFFSLSKSFNLTGLRLSYLIGNKDIVDAMKLLQSQYDFGIPYPAQKAAIAALTGPMDDVHAQCLEYQKRRDALCGGLRKAGWQVPDSDGTMFVWLPVPEGYSSMSFVEKLMDETGIIGTPGTAFGPRGEGYIRFALVRPAAEMARIAEKIGEMLARG